MAEGGSTASATPGAGADPLRDRVEDYVRAAAHVIARAEEVGPFTLFRPTRSGPTFARPRDGSDAVTADDLTRLADRFDELGAALALDWFVSRRPGLADRCREAGFRTTVHPLLTADTATPTRSGTPAGEHEVVVLAPGSPLLRAALATVAVAFGTPSSEASDHGTDDRRLLEPTYAEDRIGLLSERIGAGQAVVTAALVDGEVVATGHHRPVGDVAEVVGVATLPAFRRRGLATALTHAQVRHAADHGVSLLLLTAAEPPVEHLFTTLGFRVTDRVGQAVD